ncbi:hypothetical protein SAMN03080594_102415 [Arenibacter palladensis]|uniref:Uncharacterized protein n=1 Tax=Arenibacter palladensis TaxID=237373 RepID=A0A1M4YE67_9FLAO|nr:hypothetical protein [Arenibacter palladensis]SHF04124.1 hypothetical protein SAMN03080594_102415 [Arenibacter palladensis]
MDRRKFIKSNVFTAMTAGGLSMLPNFLLGGTQPGEKKSYVEYLEKSAVPKEELDIFLNQDSWAQFDPEVGYILGNYMPHDGIDNSYTLSTVMKDGKRTNSVYVDKPCRINTYGNSFTHCHQVSDSETWQEYLAGHLGEPIQNFGMGGFGVYQAYRRLVRREKEDKNSKYVILYMWGDDYVRSVFRCRYASYYTRWNDYGGYMFHGNFWSNIEMDTHAGKLVEKESRINTKEDMYKMTDPEFMYNNLKDDLMLQLYLMSYDMVNSDVDVEGLTKLANILELPEVDFSSTESMKSTSNALKNKYSFEATKYILKKTDEFCKANGKQFLLVHFDPTNVFRAMVNGEKRYDQEMIDFINNNGYAYFDMNEVHHDDFKKFNLSLDEYMDRYFIGHYNPSGNHFFAYAIKDKIVDWLDPKPITYLQNDDKLIRFKGYLPK